jgi:hypothetical protein
MIVDLAISQLPDVKDLAPDPCVVYLGFGTARWGCNYMCAYNDVFFFVSRWSLCQDIFPLFNSNMVVCNRNVLTSS